MNLPDETPLTPGEVLHADNEVKKLKAELALETTPPKGLDEWLAYLDAHDTLGPDTPKISVHELVGQPAYRPADELSDEETTRELDRLLGVLASKGIVLDVWEEYPNGVIYQFLTEEFLFHQTDNLPVPKGAFCHFCYEDFHPHHPSDLRRCCDEFLDELKSFNFDAMWVRLSERFCERPEPHHIVLKPAVEKALRRYVEVLAPLTITGWRVETPDVSDDKNPASAEVTLYLGLPEQPAVQSETGHFAFVHEFGFWSISRVQLGDWVLE